MQQGYGFIRDAIKSFPLPLDKLESKLKSVANSYLPYSTGMEIECNIKSTNGSRRDSIFVEEMFKSISNIMAVDIDNHEQRFRIPKGVEGAICLYNITEKLKEYSSLNPASGIHYHIDFTDITRDQFNNLLEQHRGTNSFILKALKSWDYKGNYNSWYVSGAKDAVRFHKTYQTVEFRIGEMTFDYELIMKRILHCQNICKKLKQSLITN